MLLTDEQYVIKWLSQYGPLPKAQVVRLLRDKSPSTAERILKRLEQDHRIAPVGDGYYLGLDPYGTPDQRMILAVWVLLANLPFILIQRYNRPRLMRLAALLRKRAQRKGEQNARTDPDL